MFKNLLIILLAMCFCNTARTQQVLQIAAHTDQYVYLCGEELWVDGTISGAAVAPKFIQVQLLDRKGIAKAEARFLNNNGKFSGSLVMPPELVSDYYFLDAYVPGNASAMEMRPVLVINPRIPIAACTGSQPAPGNSASPVNTVTVLTDKNAYAKREKIVLSTDKMLTGADVSVMVQRYDPLASFADSVISKSRIWSEHAAVGEKEVEGNIIRARVLSTMEGSPRKGIRVFAAIKGDQAKVSSAVSDAEGRVKFVFPFIYGETQVVFSVEASSGQQFRIEMEEDSHVQAPINFPCLQLAESMRPAIEERILAYRVQRGYYGDPAKQYTIQDVDTTDFYGRPDHHYALDDYVRFPDMKEILLEFVPEVKVRSGESEAPVVQILDEPFKTYFEAKGLIMLDGIPVHDTKELLAFNPLLVKSIDVMSRKYYLGDTTFNGILHYKTYRGDLAGFTLPARDVIYPYNGIQIPAIPIFPDYSTGNDRPLPDLRNLLFLASHRTVTGKEKLVIPFYTGDSDGRYRIIVQGTDATGNKLYGEKIISIE